MTRVAHVLTSTSDLVPNEVPASIVLGPNTLTGQPDGTRTPVATVYSSGGRPITSGFTLIWEIDDDVNFDVNASTGEVTYPSTDGLNTNMRCSIASPSVTSNDIAVVCSAFNGMSAAAAAFLEDLRSGLSTDLTVINHLVPGTTTIGVDSAPEGTGWVTASNYAPQGPVVDDAGANYGKAIGAFTYGHVRPYITSLTKTNPIVLTVADTSVITGDSAWSPNAFFTFKGINGVTQVADVGFHEIGIVNSTTVRFGSHVRHGGADYACIATSATMDGQAWGGLGGWMHVSSAASEPGVGANWEDYWVVVPTLAVAPGSWTTPQQFYSMDATAWTWDAPPPGFARLGYSAGGGTFKVEQVPGFQNGSVFPRVMYGYGQYKIGSDYKLNDSAGSQKWWYFGCDIGYGSYQGGYMPFPLGGGLDENNDPKYHGTIHVANCHNGVDLPENDFQMTMIGPDIYPARNVWEVWETIIVYGLERGDESSIDTFRNGVHVSHDTACWLDPNDTPRTRLAHRYGSGDWNNTYGGGGTWPEGDMHLYIGELYLSGGWINADEQPTRFIVTAAGGNSHPAGATVTLTVQLVDGADRRLDVSSGWPYFTHSVDGGSLGARYGGTGPGQHDLGATAGQFNVDWTLPGSPGTAHYSAQVERVSNNNVRDGVKYLGSLTMTVT